jgi:uncharacterized protein
MRYQAAGGVFVVRLDPEEEIVTALASFCEANRIDAGTVSGIGSARHAVIAFFDRDRREYESMTIEEDTEIASLTGNVALKDGKAFLHLHATLASRRFQVFAGHLMEARVASTTEVVIRPAEGWIQRAFDPQSGLYLLELR